MPRSSRRSSGSGGANRSSGSGGANSAGHKMSLRPRRALGDISNRPDPQGEADGKPRAAKRAVSTVLYGFLLLSYAFLVHDQRHVLILLPLLCAPNRRGRKGPVLKLQAGQGVDQHVVHRL
jgi:hypothetical protein